MASVKQADPLLSGSYSLDSTAPDTGRGTITLTSSMTGQHEYAFYIVDATHLYLVEVDNNDYLGGKYVQWVRLRQANLAAGSYVFTAGGTSSSGAYASGGVFTAAGQQRLREAALPAAYSTATMPAPSHQTQLWALALSPWTQPAASCLV